MTRNERIKKRYHLLRNLGYDSKEANKLKHASVFDTDKIKLKTVNNKTVLVQSPYIKNKSHIVDAELTSLSSMPNKSIYTDWGDITHSKGKKDRIAKLVRFINIRDKQDKNSDYGYWYLYNMYMGGYDDKTMQKQVNEKRTWEEYKKNKGKKK